MDLNSLRRESSLVPGPVPDNASRAHPKGQAMKHMAYKVIDRLFVVVFGTAEPSDDEWTTYLAVVERHGIDRTMQLIVTDGGVPSYGQRKYLNERLAGRSVPVAVVSGSRRIVTVVTAMSWFNREIKAFPPSGFREAIAYLQIPASRTELIEREIERLKLELDNDRRATA